MRWLPLRIHVGLNVEIAGPEPPQYDSETSSVAEPAAETTSPELHIGFRPNQEDHDDDMLGDQE